MKGCLAFILAILAVLVVSGLCNSFSSQSAADAYKQGPTERVPGTVRSTQVIYGVVDQDHPKGYEACQVVVVIADRTVTTRMDPLGGACDDNTVLQPGVAVQVEYWKGKVTAIFYGTTEFLAEGNPALSNAVPQAQVFFAGLLAIPVLALLVLDFAVGGVINMLRRRGLLPKRRTRRPVVKKVPASDDFHIYPPE